MGNTRGPFSPSPGALALLAGGTTGKRVAEALGVSGQLVSAMLDGTRPVRPEMFVAIRALAGPAVAEEVRRQVEVAHGQRVAP